VRRSIWEEGHGMVYAQNIDSGQSNSQLGTRSSGSCRNLVYLRIRGAILGQALQHSLDRRPRWHDWSSVGSDNQ
jgi:hypothetical protein